MNINIKYCFHFEFHVSAYYVIGLRGAARRICASAFDWCVSLIEEIPNKLPYIYIYIYTLEVID